MIGWPRYPLLTHPRPLVASLVVARDTPMPFANGIAGEALTQMQRLRGAVHARHRRYWAYGDEGFAGWEIIEARAAKRRLRGLLAMLRRGQTAVGCREDGAPLLPSAECSFCGAAPGAACPYKRGPI